MRQNADLHGNAPDNSSVALLLIEVINDLEFEGGEELLRHALPAAKQIASFKKRCHAKVIPAIYINDNFGKWRSDFKKLMSHCINDNTRGREIVELLKPERDDYFVLKPKHSGFYSTALDLLLKHLGAETLIMTGFTADICVLFTANDAYVRDYRLLIPSDCVASQDEKENQRVLRFMRRVLKPMCVRAPMWISPKFDKSQIEKVGQLASPLLLTCFWHRHIVAALIAGRPVDPTAQPATFSRATCSRDP